MLSFRRAFFIMLFCAICFAHNALLSQAQETNQEKDVQTYQVGPVGQEKLFHFPKPALSSLITNIPDTYVSIFHDIFSKEALPYWGIVAGSTLVLYHYDQVLINEVQRFGRKIGMGNKDRTATMISYKGISIFRGPKDLGSSFYFIGDGWTHAITMASFFTYGQIAKNYRAQATSAALAHGLIVSTIANQFLKRTTGRQSPYRATKDRGVWNLFPNQDKYNKNISYYDAYPSGHLQTLTMTATVILENYPEYAGILKPTFIGLGTLLGLQMLNNGVHWASDYPLGIALGYLFGKAAARSGRWITDKNEQSQTSLSFFPILDQSGGGIGLTYQY